jgi:hypothetical protein
MRLRRPALLRSFAWLLFGVAVGVGALVVSVAVLMVGLLIAFVVASRASNGSRARRDHLWLWSSAVGNRVDSASWAWRRLLAFRSIGHL